MCSTLVLSLQLQFGDTIETGCYLGEMCVASCLQGPAVHTEVSKLQTSIRRSLAFLSTSQHQSLAQYNMFTSTMRWRLEKTRAQTSAAVLSLSCLGAVLLH